MSMEEPHKEHNGCKCHRCGRKYKMDLLVDDALWEKIKPKGKSKGAGLLCPSCIVSSIEDIYGHSAFKIISGEHVISDRAPDIISSFMRYCKENGLIIPEGYFEQYFNPFYE